MPVTPAADDGHLESGWGRQRGHLGDGAELHLLTHQRRIGRGHVLPGGHIHGPLQHGVVGNVRLAGSIQIRRQQLYRQVLDVRPVA